ncbi:MAG: tRNA-guanine transglycosylase [Pirellulales bacterium]|nr:tRNA-guanine transglycosylase [Pirellulales bacterium]
MDDPAGLLAWEIYKPDLVSPFEGPFALMDRLVATLGVHGFVIGGTGSRRIAGQRLPFAEGYYQFRDVPCRVAIYAFRRDGQILLGYLSQVLPVSSALEGVEESFVAPYLSAGPDGVEGALERAREAMDAGRAEASLAIVEERLRVLPNEPEVVRQAAERTVRWAERCRDAARRKEQTLFGIVQGGLDPQLRIWCAERLVELDFPGYAIGGLSVGESPEEMYRTLQTTVPALPSDRPRYLMGVGRPADLLEAVHRGVDLFDCVMPTRNGRNSMAFTDQGCLRLRNLQYERDNRPIEQGCSCVACQRSRGYIRHLFMAGEMLGPILLSIHNLAYYQRLLAGAREAIVSDRFCEYRRERLRGWGERDAADAGF